MDSFNRIRAILYGLAGLLAGPLAAQDIADSLPLTADSLQMTADVGFVNTAGNTDLTTINVGEELNYVLGRFTLGQTFGLVFGRSEGVTTSSLWRAGVRGEYALSQRVSAFANLAFDRNRFAGIARRFEEGIGILVKLLETPRNRLEVEGGLSLVQQRSILEVSENYPAARAAGQFVHHFAEETYFQQLVELIPSLETADDFRLNSESSLVAPLSRQLALKVSYVIRFDNEPELGFEKTDRLLTTGLQVTL
jgi:putative salt-induced outer membrane protein